jgi:hypothetical protein
VSVMEAHVAVKRAGLRCTDACGVGCWMASVPIIVLKWFEAPQQKETLLDI